MHGGAAAIKADVEKSEMTHDDKGEALRVLIVEDNETDYLLLLRQVLKVFDKAVCERAENREQLFASIDQCWDLIITDYHLLDIEGDELLAAVATAHNRPPCILMSGSMDQLEKAKFFPNVFARLEKGDMATLREALQQVLPH